MHVSLPVRMLAGAALVALAACGGGTSSSSSTTTVKTAPTTEAQREQSALPLGQTAAVPKDLNCGAVKPVWVNLNTKAYHLEGDPYYGKTKNGKYECPAAAAAEGDHPAGQTHKKKKGSAMSSDTSTP